MLHIWSTSQFGASQHRKDMDVLEYIRMVGGLVHCIYEESLQDLGLFCLEKT